MYGALCVLNESLLLEIIYIYIYYKYMQIPLMDWRPSAFNLKIVDL